MTILQLIEKLETMDKLADRQKLLKAEYERNEKLRIYLDMIYGEHMTKFMDKLPAYEADPDTPNGLHYSNLERNVQIVRRIMYDEGFGKNRERSMVRILENIAPQEVDLIKAIIKTKWKWCTPRFYSEELVQNANV